YYETLNPEKGEVLAEVKKENVEKLLIKKANKEMQIPFINLVDRLLYLKKKRDSQIFTHTPNDRIAVHFEDVLNMMVYELYFEQHMKENGIDVLQFINEKLNKIKDKTIEEQIKDFYLWYQKPDNLVRQRVQLIETRSPDIIALINKSLQA
ncbi:MAG: hypothetical protein ACRDE5_15915, partial [Ginsengibacter sp.]